MQKFILPERAVANEVKVNIHERCKHLHIMHLRHLEAYRREKRCLPDEMENTPELHHKRLIRLLHDGLERYPRRRKKKAPYQDDINGMPP